MRRFSFRSLFSRPLPVVAAGIVLGLALMVGVWRWGDGHRPGGSRSDAAVAATPAPAAKSSADLTAWKVRVSSASPNDFATLIREAMRISDPAAREQVLTALVARWVTLDLPGFIAFIDAAEVDDETGGDSLWAMLVPALAQALPTLSDEAAAQTGLQELVRRLIEYAARSDPDQAFAWARQWLLDDARENALATISGEMAKRSPERALQILAEIRKPVYRVDALDAIGAVYGASHPAAAAAWARNLPVAAERPYAVNSVISAMAEVEPTRAASELLAFREGMVAAYAAQRAQDLSAMGLSEPDENTPPDEAATLSQILPGREDPQLHLLEDAAAAVAEHWAAVEPEKATAWAATLPAGRMRENVMAAALAGWASEDPRGAFAYLQSQPESPVSAATPVFESWAAAAPMDAASEAAEIKHPAVRQSAVAGVVSGWLGSEGDPAELLRWVDELPHARDRDVANAQIADVLSFDVPKVAWARATSIGSEATRRDPLRSAFASLVESDPQQARVLLAKARDLTPEENRRLSRMLEAVTPIPDK